LKPHLKEELEAFADQPAVLWWRRLSRLLFCSYGLTAKVPNDGKSDISPAAKVALYPAEVYLISVAHF